MDGCDFFPLFAAPNINLMIQNGWIIFAAKSDALAKTDTGRLKKIGGVKKRPR